MTQGPSVTGSKGLALGMCWVSLQGLEGKGDRVPETCGGMWVGGRESLDMRYEEGRVGKGKVISCQPDLVASIPGQRVQVAQEGGSFHVLLHELVQCE